MSANLCIEAKVSYFFNQAVLINLHYVAVYLKIRMRAGIVVMQIT